MSFRTSCIYLALAMIAQVQAANLLTNNPSFESLPAGYEDETGSYPAIPGWQFNFTAGGAYDYAGVYSMAATTGVDGVRYLSVGGGPLLIETRSEDRASVIGLSNYVFTCLVDYPATGFCAGVRWYSSSGTYLGSNSISPVVDHVFPQFQSFSFTSSAPANATGAGVFIALAAGATSVDGFSLIGAAGTSALTPTGSHYYVSPSGNDTNAGTLVQPWKTVNRAVTGAAPGTTIHLQGGAVFQENVYFGSGGTTGMPVKLTSDPTNRATIYQLLATQPGILIYNAGHITLENIYVVGLGTSMTTKDGVMAQAHNGRFEELMYSNVVVSGFHDGFYFYASGAAGSGFSRISMLNCVGYYNLNAGMETFAYFTGVGSFSNMVIRDCIFNNNVGDPLDWLNPSGFGMALGYAVDVLVERCVAHDNGGAGNAEPGPVGFMTYHCRRVTIQHCEAYNNKAKNQDGGGFDLDLNTSDSVIQYCYSHNNYGAGYLMNTDGVAGHWWTNNTVRYNISENDAYAGKMGALHFYSGGASAALMNSHIYGNTIYSRSSPVVGFYIGNMAGVFVRNNIFYAGSTNPLVLWYQQTNNTPLTSQVWFQGNNYWNHSGPLILAGSRSLADWRTATGQEKVDGTDAGFNVDPLLMQAGGGGTNGNPRQLNLLTAYQLRTNSPMINAGLDLPGLGITNPGLVDYYGTSIPQAGDFDIGASESLFNNTPNATGFELYTQHIMDPADRGIHEDPDHDGYPNLLEYVTGGNPTGMDAVAHMHGQWTNGAFVIRFQRATNTVDATISVMGAYSLASTALWEAVAINSNGLWNIPPPMVVETGTNPVQVVVKDSAPSASNRFMRLRIARP
jgi:hypothetical protein